MKAADQAGPFDSAAYWRQRYAKGGNSGPGSYGRLSVYKANFINELCHRRKIRSVIEFGSGDGHQASMFAVRNYLGVDVSELAVTACQEMFKDRTGWRFMTLDDFETAPQRAELSISLDVIYHLIEDAIFESYMVRLFAAATDFVLIYASDKAPFDSAVHVRHRPYSEWVTEHLPEWTEVKSWENPFARSAKSDPETTSYAFFRLYKRKRLA